MKSLLVVLMGLAILAALASIPVYFFMSGTDFTPSKDTFIFTRDIRQDRGRELTDWSRIVATGGSKKGLHLSEVFSDVQQKRYGFDTDALTGGVGLEVTGIIKNGDQVIKKVSFKIVGWEVYEEGGNNDARNALVADKKSEFEGSFIREFTGQIEMKFTFAVVLDATEGVDEVLARRVREVVQETKAEEFAEQGADVIVVLYHVTESAYQGGRHKIRVVTKRGDLEKSMEWFLGPQKEEKSSSVLRGMLSIFREVEGYKDESPSIHLFSDGLENLPELSVYRNPELLEEENWSKLDEVADLGSLDLTGIEIYLHPLPPKNARHEAMMEGGLQYLRSRLKQAGASVRIEAF